MASLWKPHQLHLRPFFHKQKQDYFSEQYPMPFVGPVATSKTQNQAGIYVEHLTERLVSVREAVLLQMVWWIHNHPLMVT